VIDLLKAQYPPKLIRDTFNLTDAQINVALSYIKENQIEVEAEYQEVLQTREEIRQYWEERNRERLARIAAMSRQPGKEAIWAKLEEQKARRSAAQKQ
jgi:predicted house-cleaning noncanonical NTP pyrophosphatase (MazG superfamily)